MKGKLFALQMHHIRTPSQPHCITRAQQRRDLKGPTVILDGEVEDITRGIITISQDVAYMHVINVSWRRGEQRRIANQYSVPIPFILLLNQDP